MFSALALLLALTCEAKVTKWSRIFVGPGFNEQYAKDEYKSMKNIDCRESSEEDGNEVSEEEIKECEDIVEGLQEYKYSKGSDINSQLKKLSKVNEAVFIVGFKMAELDFNNLKAQMKVAIEYDDTVNEYSINPKANAMKFIKRLVKAKFDGSPQSFMRLNSLNKKPRNVKPKDDDDVEVISIVGDIQKKVSFLGIDEGYIKFTKNDINVHTLGLEAVYFHEDSKKIRTNFLLVKGGAIELMEEIIDGSDFVRVDQYSVYYSYHAKYDGEATFGVSYGEKSWTIVGRYDKYDRIESSRVPYETASTINIIANATSFIIAREEDVNLNSYPPVNVSAIYLGAFQEMYAKQLTENIELEFNGWENVDSNKKPKVTVSYDERYYQIDTEKYKDFNVVPELKYSYEPQNRKNVNVGLIVGVVIACVVVVAIIIVVVIIVIRKKRANQGSASEKEGNADDA